MIEPQSKPYNTFESSDNSTDNSTNSSSRSNSSKNSNNNKNNNSNSNSNSTIKRMDFDSTNVKETTALLRKPNSQSHAPVSTDSRSVSIDSRHHYDNNDPNYYYVRMLAAIAALNSCNLGYDMGVNAGVAESLQRGEGNGLYLNNVQLEMFMGMLSFTALIGSVAMSYISDIYGRKMTFIVSSFVFISGVMIMVISPTYPILMAGRAVTGFGIGLGLAIDPMYISEISPSHLRGFLVSCSETAINVGIVLGYIASFLLRNVPDNLQWRLMIALGIPLPTIFLFLVVFVLPESPRWMIHKGMIEEAAVILEDLTHRNGMRQARKIKKEIDRDHLASKEITWNSLIMDDPVRRRKLIAGVGTAVAQQITAEEAILYYMIIIFNDAGITSVSQRFAALVAVGIAKVMAIVVAGYLFDYFGRKPLIMASNFGIGVSLFLLATAGDIAPYFSFIALVLYVVSFSCGMGPGAWLIPSEVFSNEIRAKGMSLCTVSNRLAALIITTTFLSARVMLTNFGAFSIFGVIAFMNVLFVYKFVPETKGKTLEEISEIFENEVNGTVNDEDSNESESDIEGKTVL